MVTAANPKVARPGRRDYDSMAMDAAGDPESAAETELRHHASLLVRAATSKAKVPHPSGRPRQDMMLDGARDSVALAQSYLPDMENLEARIRDRVKRPEETGLPAMIRSLRRAEMTLALAVSELRGASLDEDALTRLDKKAGLAAIDVSRGAMDWDILKRCRSLVAVNRVFQGSERQTRKRDVSRLAPLGGREKQQLHRVLREQAKVEVHVVDDGREWVDVKTLHADRLARQMTDAGWGWGEHRGGDDVDEAEWDGVPLARHVRRLVAAARLNRHEYRFPRVRLVLPNLARGQPDVDALLDQLTRLDPLVRVAVVDGRSAWLAAGCPRADAAVEGLGDAHEGLTPTLNLDHTILVDLASDLTHRRLEPRPWQAPTTRAQILDEARHGGRMARTLYPLLAGRALVCTSQAAAHFHAVVAAVGAAAECERARLLVPVDGRGDGDAGPARDDELRARFQTLSAHALPASVQVPVRVVAAAADEGDWTLASVDRAVAEGRLPVVARDVARCANLTGSKLSVFMHGWATGLVTLTSNKEVRGQFRTWVEANRHADSECGPVIWVIDVTRNLLAKGATPREQDSETGCWARRS